MSRSFVMGLLLAGCSGSGDFRSGPTSELPDQDARAAPDSPVEPASGGARGSGGSAFEDAQDGRSGGAAGRSELDAGPPPLPGSGGAPSTATDAGDDPRQEDAGSAGAGGSDVDPIPAAGGSSGAGGTGGSGPGDVDPCDPPSVGGPTSGGEDCSGSCGWTLETRPAGYGVGGTSCSAACGTVNRDVSRLSDWSVVLGSGRCAPDYSKACGRRPEYRFHIDAGQCARFTSSDPELRSFVAVPSTTTGCDSACLVVSGDAPPTPDEDFPGRDVLALSSSADAPVAWVRVEVATEDDGVCPLACP